MSYKEYKPSDELKMFIKCFWIMEKDYSINSRNKGLEFLWTTGLTEILYIIGNKFKYLNGEAEEILYSKDNNEIVDYLNRYCSNFIRNDEFSKVLHKIYTEDNISLQELAEESNLSLRQFERKVKKFTGFTPKQLVTIVRFYRARKTMLFTKDYIQVMTDLGYYDYSHFSKDFKKYFSITPKEFIDIYNRYWFIYVAFLQY